MGSKHRDAPSAVIDRSPLPASADKGRESEGKRRPLAFGNPERRRAKRQGGNAEGMHSQANDHVQLRQPLWERAGTALSPRLRGLIEETLHCRLPTGQIRLRSSPEPTRGGERSDRAGAARSSGA